MNDASNITGAGSNLLPSSVLPRPHWFVRLLACNPFYLVSAALLLFGLYRVSVEPGIFLTEGAQLVFNFTSLQFYELLLVGTAIVLARRRIWYDSMLLLVLENLLFLVPFMLINQAGLIEQRTLWFLCGLTVLLAGGRWGGAQRGIEGLKFSPRLLVGGVLVLLVNAAMVIVFRTLQEDKVGTMIEAGAAYDTNVACWLWLLPVLLALANLLPRPGADGKLLVERRWFPVSLFLTWIAGTVVHLYALGYIYDYPLRREWVAPALAALVWTLHIRFADFVPEPARWCRNVTLLLPMLAALPAVGAGSGGVFFVLTALNAVGYVVVIVRQPDYRLARYLLLAAVALLVVTVPREMVTMLNPTFSREKFIAAALALGVLVATLLTRNPKAAFAGAFAAAMGAGMLHGGEYHAAAHWAAQAGLIFVLLHSLRWRDYEHRGASGARFFVAAVWVLHALVWSHTSQAFWQPAALASAVMVAWWFRGYVFRNWKGSVLPVAAALVALSGPLNFVWAKVQVAPAGILAVAASFLLFAVGTVVALTKHRWHRRPES